MANRSVIQVDVNDDKFKAFQALFNKYHATLTKMPAQWAQVNATQKAGGKDFTAAAAAMAKSAQESAKIAKNIERAAKGQKAVTKGAKDSNFEFDKAARTTGKIAKNVAQTTFHLLKWVALGGVIGAATGLFGMDRLAGAAGNTRRQAQGYGVTPGELKAARVNFGNYVDAEGMLGNISNAQMDLSKRGLFARFGLDPSKSPGELMPQLLPKLASEFKRGGGTQQWADASGLSTFANMSELKRLSGLPSGELAGAVGGYQKDRDTLNVQDAQLRSMQNLTNQFDRAADAIENTFIKGLVPLAPALGTLSASVSKTIESLMSSPQVGKWIADLGVGVEDLAKYIQTGEFKKTVGDVVTALGYLVKGINTVGHWLFGSDAPSDGKPAKAAAVAATAAGSPQASTGGATGHWETGGATGTWGSQTSNDRHNPGNIRSWGDLPRKGGFAVFPDDNAGLRAMSRQLQLYGSRGNDTLSGIISSWSPPSDKNDTPALISAAAKRTGYSPVQHLNTNDINVLSNVIAAITKQENHKSNFTPAGVRAVITVENQTGGSVNISANQLAH